MTENPTAFAPAAQETPIKQLASPCGTPEEPCGCAPAQAGLAPEQPQTASPEDAIVVRQLTKRFDELQALTCVNMNVPAGAVYGLVGPNGAGKSTLINHLTGAYRADSGSVRILGQEVFENPQVKQRIACIGSNLYFPASESIEGMAQLYGSAYPNFDTQRFLELASSFDLDRKRPLRKFSKGMQKQAAFWLTLALSPDVLLLDEPMDGLDPLVRRRMWSLVLSDVAQRGMTVLISSHNLRELEGVCSHLGIMAGGAMLCERDLSSLDGGIVKVQVALPDDESLDPQLEVLSSAAEGRLQTLIIHGNAQEITARLQASHPVLLELAPLSLEELFLFELGGVNDEVKDLVL